MRVGADRMAEGWWGLVTQLLRSPLVTAACAPRVVDDYLDLFNPLWSLSRTRARIMEVRPERGGAVSLFLRPSRNFEGFVPGQCVSLTAVDHGMRHTRCFSLSSAPHEGLLRLTILARPEGKLGAWVAKGARPGAVVEISQAMGGFGELSSTADRRPPPVLLVAGGVGITPMRSILKDLAARGDRREVTCLHFSRREHLFGEELSALATDSENLRYVPILTALRSSGDSARSRLSAALLDAHMPDWRDAQVLLCGPQRLESAMRACLQRIQRAQHLQVERFTPAVLPVRSTRKSRANSRTHRVTLSRSAKELRMRSDRTLLEQLEQAGLRPPHGCRQGLCHTCKVTLHSGRVHCQGMGAIEGEHNTRIQLCVSHPRSDLELDL